MTDSYSNEDLRYHLDRLREAVQTTPRISTVNGNGLHHLVGLSELIWRTRRGVG